MVCKPKCFAFKYDGYMRTNIFQNTIIPIQQIKICIFFKITLGVEQFTN